MLSFYAAIIRRTPGVLYQAILRHNRIAGAVAVGTVGLKPLLEWAGVAAVSELLPWWWPALIVGIFAAWGLLRANYEAHEAVRARVVEYQGQVAAFTELRPLVISGIDEDHTFCRLLVTNPNPRPVPDCRVRLTGVECIQTIYKLGRMPPIGFVFPRSDWSGGGLTFSISSRGTAEINIARPERHRTGIALPSEREGPTLPGGIYEFSIQVESESAVIEPTLARLRVELTGEGTNRALEVAIVAATDASAD